jgi:hypothetical protein
MYMYACVCGGYKEIGRGRSRTVELCECFQQFWDEMGREGMLGLRQVLSPVFTFILAICQNANIC